MKQTHITIPRTLAECQFTPSADPIERLEAHSSWVGSLATVAGVIFLVVAAAVVAIGAA